MRIDLNLPQINKKSFPLSQIRHIWNVKEPIALVFMPRVSRQKLSRNDDGGRYPSELAEVRGADFFDVIENLKRGMYVRRKQENRAPLV